MYLNRGFQSSEEFEDYLNGVVTSKKSFSGPFTGATSLDGLTLIFDPGGGDVTVTFVGTNLTLNQVVTQINAASAGAAGLRNYGRNPPSGSLLAFIKSGLIVKSTGTANALLGFPTTTNLTVTPIAKAKIVAVEQDHCARIFWILHET